MASSEALVWLDLSAGVELEGPLPGQDFCYFDATIPDGEAGAGAYRAPCYAGDWVHGSNPVWCELYEATRARTAPGGRGLRLHAVIGVQGDEIRAVRWWTLEP